ncbi:MAG: UDP-N-acetylenolpyruvoylglucosamine reductase [Parcubacteria group bacterium]|nr:UDP-N-acetylenolpyruvoylglucosamine reductase [Parcubacteria group bacterium]
MHSAPTLQESVSLKERTTLNVGGQARYFIDATTIEQVRSAVRFARKRELPLFILGGGSNILISDEGYRGVVLSLSMRETQFNEDGTTIASAGVVWDELVTETIARELSGLECLSGIPGTVGGAVVANAGAYGAECSDVFVSAEVIDLIDPTLPLITLRKDACAFSYHDSMFSRESAQYAIVSVTLKLIPGGSSQSTYRDYRFEIPRADPKSSPSLQEVRTRVLDIREKKGALILYGRESYQCAGSFFHMPFVTAEQYEAVLSKAQELDASKERMLRPWFWKQLNGSYKLAPGFLLEFTEFQKGYIRGAVGISPRHTLSIINRGGATAADIAQLAKDMQQRVATLFGVFLEQEVVSVGFNESVKII